MKKYDVQPLDLMQFINTKYHDPFIHELIEFEDGVDAERLLHAIERLAEAFPLLKCRYERADNTYVENEPFSARYLLRIDGGADRTALLTEALDMDKKFVQFTLAGHALVVTISHLIADGSGFKQLLYLLCELYNGKADEIPGHLMQRDFSQLTEGLTGTGALAFKMLLSMIGNYKSQPVYAREEEEGAFAVERTIPRETMTRAHSRAKQEGATLNDVFLTAYARALGAQNNLTKIMIPCTVDLRKYAKGETGVGNLTGSYNFNIKLREGEGFAAALTRASAVMQKQKRTKNDIAGPMLLVGKYRKSSLSDFLKLYGGMDTSAFTDYTNLGVLDDKRLVFDGAAVKRAVGYSGLNKAPCFQMAVSSFRGETTVSSLVRCGKAGKEKAERILDAVVQEIASLADGTP